MSHKTTVFPALDEEHERALAAPLPWPVSADLPEGWHRGAHISLGAGRGTAWWVFHYHGAFAVIETRSDVDVSDCRETVETLADKAVASPPGDICPACRRAWIHFLHPGIFDRDPPPATQPSGPGELSDGPAEAAESVDISTPSTDDDVVEAWTLDGVWEGDLPRTSTPYGAEVMRGRVELGRDGLVRVAEQDRNPFGAPSWVAPNPGHRILILEACLADLCQLETDAR